MKLYLLTYNMALMDCINNRIRSKNHAIKYIEKYHGFKYLREEKGNILIFTSNESRFGIYHRYLLVNDISKE